MAGGCPAVLPGIRPFYLLPFYLCPLRLYLAQRVKNLQNLTQKICAARIEAYLSA
jgi:hypothetical protein